jgi:hypothetical protein
MGSNPTTVGQQSILSEIVSVFPTLGFKFEPREAPDGDRQLRAAPRLLRGSLSCFSEQASYILKAYKACLGLNINIKILYLNRRPLDRKWRGSRDSLLRAMHSTSGQPAQAFCTRIWQRDSFVFHVLFSSSSSHRKPSSSHRKPSILPRRCVDSLIYSGQVHLGIYQ